MSRMREGDIRDIRNRAKAEGRPLVSTVINDKDGNKTFYIIDKKTGNPQITDVWDKDKNSTFGK